MMAVARVLDVLVAAGMVALAIAFCLGRAPKPWELLIGLGGGYIVGRVISQMGGWAGMPITPRALRDPGIDQ